MKHRASITMAPPTVQVGRVLVFDVGLLFLINHHGHTSYCHTVIRYETSKVRKDVLIACDLPSGSIILFSVYPL